MILIIAIWLGVHFIGGWPGAGVGFLVASFINGVRRLSDDGEPVLRIKMKR